MADSKLKDERYYVVHGWMMNHLRLKGVALSVYAIIYGFSQDGENEYTGTLQYLCNFCGGVSKPTIIKALKELVEAGFILRREENRGNTLVVRYRVNLTLVTPSVWQSEPGVTDSKVKDERYYIIHGWMMNRLDLKGIKLSVYAIIYGFSQNKDNEFTGTLKYLCDFCGGVSKPTVINALKELVEAGLILRREENISNVIFVRYRANLELAEISVPKMDTAPVKNVECTPEGGKKTLPGVVKKFDRGSKETLPPSVKELDPTGKETLPKKEIYKKADSKDDILHSVIAYLNEQTKKAYRPTNHDTQHLINKRLSEGYTLADFIAVIDKKCTEWMGTYWEQYLSPVALFGIRFEQYLFAPAYARKGSPATSNRSKQQSYDISEFEKMILEEDYLPT